MHVVSAKDLASIGSGSTVPGTGYTIFASGDKPTECYGQFVALVCATSQSMAQRAAKLVVVAYAEDGEDGGGAR